MNHDHPHGPVSGNKMKFRANWILIGFLLLAGYFLFTEHRAHLLGWLSGWLSSYGIWLLLLACPLMHLFMHGGHGSHGSHHDDGGERPDQKRTGEKL